MRLFFHLRPHVPLESKTRGKLRGKRAISDENERCKQAQGKEICQKMKKKPIIFRYLAEKQYLCSPKSRISYLHIINIYKKTT